MSHPIERSATRIDTTDATSHNPPTTTPASPSSSSATAASATGSPPMKKAKSQAAAPCALDIKNGLHHHTQHHQQQDFNPTDDVVYDHSSMSIDEDLRPDDPAALSSSRGTVAANLSRKKAQPPQPAKKLVIKLVKAKPTIPSNFEEDTWAKLKSAICAIFLKRPDSCDLEQLYQAVNDLCLHKMGGNLYQRIEKECEAHISAAIQSLIGQSPAITCRAMLAGSL